MLACLGLLTFLLLGSISSIFVSVEPVFPEQRVSDYSLEFNKASWNTSDYINFTAPLIKPHPSVEWYFRIFIDDTDPNYNWSITALNNSWCTGSGTDIDPYVIENLYIDGNGSGGMIEITNSDKYFIIKDCWFNYSGPNSHDVGVFVYFATNGMIVDNSFTYLHKGVDVGLDSSNITVDNNIFISNHNIAGLGVGIHVGSYCDTIVVSNNKIRNYYSPLSIDFSVNILVSGNYIDSNIWTLPTSVLFQRINDSEVIWNVFAGSFALTSTFTVLDTEGQGNTVINNTVGTGDPWVFGPETSEAFLSTPQLSQNNRQIWLLDSYNNLIAHNVLHGFIGGGNGGTIHGFNIFILIGMFGIISVLFLVVKRKRQ